MVVVQLKACVLTPAHNLATCYTQLDRRPYPDHPDSRSISRHCQYAMGIIAPSHSFRSPTLIISLTVARLLEARVQNSSYIHTVECIVLRRMKNEADRNARQNETNTSQASSVHRIPDQVATFAKSALCHKLFQSEPRGHSSPSPLHQPNCPES